MLDKIYKSDLNATHISANYDDDGRLIYDTFRTFRLEIGENAMIGAGSVVTKNIKAYTTVYGNPAKEKK